MPTAFIDTDEFLVLTGGSEGGDAGAAAGQKPLEQLLRGYEQYGGLVVNWRMFGSGAERWQGG